MLWGKGAGKLSGEAKTANKNLTKEKIEKASGVVSQILSEAGPHVVLFSGGAASCALLHIIREVGNQEIPGVVCHVDLLRNQIVLYQYLEKMRRLWGFDLIRERNWDLVDLRDITGDWEEFYYAHTREILYGVAEKYGLRYLLLPQHNESKTDSCQEIRSRSGFHFFEIRPLVGFTTEEVATMIRTNNIPLCPIFRRAIEGAAREWPEGNREGAVTFQTSIEIEKEEMASKLKSLGYL